MKTIWRHKAPRVFEVERVPSRTGYGVRTVIGYHVVPCSADNTTKAEAQAIADFLNRCVTAQADEDGPMPAQALLDLITKTVQEQK